MRWWSVLCACLVVSHSARCGPDNDNAVTTAVSASVLGTEGAALALRDLAVIVLQAAGVQAAPVPSPPACAVPDSDDCLQQIIGTLSAGKATVALATVPAEAVPPVYELRDQGIEELGEATAPSRRACLATTPPARSLLDLTNEAVASIYHVPDKDISDLTNSCRSFSCNITLSPEWCRDRLCATLLTSSEGEANILWNQVLTHKLYATIRPLGERLYQVTSLLAERPLVVCAWAPELTPLANLSTEALGPPPCLAKKPCPFETRRIVKYINIRELAHAPSAVRALVRLDLSGEKMKELAELVAVKGHEIAAKEFYQAQPPSARMGEVRVAVLLPQETSKEAYDARALAAAATLAEADLREEFDSHFAAASFKVELADDGCHTAAAYKYWNDALGTSEFGALSALVGPACGAAWPDLAKYTLAHTVPMLAYTAQAPASAPYDKSVDTPLQVLAAGDARDAASALAALVHSQGWRRVAVLTEPATRPLLEAVRAQAKFDVFEEVKDLTQNNGVDSNVIHQWVTRAVAENTKILYLCVEDMRIARAALCAARSAGLTPTAGAVWLLCAAHKPGWLQAAKNENCTTQQLQEVAEGHFTATPEWALTWERNGLNASIERREWEKRWRKRCRLLPHEASDTSCDVSPGPLAALLYDILHQWATALYLLLQQNGAAVDDLHNHVYVRTLINYTTATEFEGLTGRFEWNKINDAHARTAPMILSQWHSKIGARKVGNWTKGSFQLEQSALKWYTQDGRTPDDGREICALQGLADALHADCRTAYIALGALLVAILIAALAGTALHCKRLAEKEYRKRLQDLGMRPLAMMKPAGLDKWEIPRERVVINRKLGTGAFGTVYGGHALLAEDRGWSAVAVKTLKAGATTEEKLDFLSEAEAMKRFDHKNVVKLLGVVTKTEPVCTVMEFMLYGDLKNYLLARRHLAMGGGEEESSSDEASGRRLTGMALDVARALSYLAQLRYVHRDVAARNCLVSARRVVKLADFGMTRLVFENDYYRFSRKGMLPVRWMAPESLALGVFSPASDVWSFGVLLYEIVTFGSLPFQGLSNSEVLGRVKAGHTLELPPGLKPQLEGLIKSCWQQDPKARPTASEVAAFLADAPRLLAPCLDIPLDALPLDGDPPWRLSRDQAEARWVSWAAPASAATDTTYLSADGAVPLDTDSFLP